MYVSDLLAVGSEMPVGGSKSRTYWERSSSFCQQSFRQTLLLDLGSARRLVLCPVDSGLSPLVPFRIAKQWLLTGSEVRHGSREFSSRSLLSEPLSETRKGSERGHRPKYRSSFSSLESPRKGAVPRTAHPYCQVYLAIPTLCYLAFVDCCLLLHLGPLCLLILHSSVPVLSSWSMRALHWAMPCHGQMQRKQLSSMQISRWLRGKNFHT